MLNLMPRFERTLQNLMMAGSSLGTRFGRPSMMVTSTPIAFHRTRTATNHAATEHDSALGQVVHLQRLSGGQNATLNGQTKGLGDRAGCQDNVLTLVLNTTDGDGVLSGQLTLAGDNLLRPSSSAGPQDP